MFEGISMDLFQIPRLYIAFLSLSSLLRWVGGICISLSRIPSCFFLLLVLSCNLLGDLILSSLFFIVSSGVVAHTMRWLLVLHMLQGIEWFSLSLSSSYSSWSFLVLPRFDGALRLYRYSSSPFSGRACRLLPPQRPACSSGSFHL